MSCRLLLLAALVGAALAASTNKESIAFTNKQPVASPKSSPGFTRCYDNAAGGDPYVDLVDYQPDLRTIYFDNRISSACQTGLWFYYSETDYNKGSGGFVYWMHGIEYCGEFPRTFDNMASSIRFGGSPFYLNEDSFTLYEGDSFTGDEFWSNQHEPDLSYIANRGSSLVITGQSAWTFYSELNYNGRSVCVYPSTDHDVNGNDRLDLGLFPSISSTGISDDSVSSVAKGCYSSTVVKAERLPAEHRAAHGAMGVIRL